MINSTATWRSRLIGVRGAERAWLTDQGSLTQRILARCPRFAVRHVQQQRAAAALDEALLCGLKPACVTTLREVYLYCHDIPVVFAHSVLPTHSLRGGWQGLGKLGSKPLGGALFANPLVQRTPLQFTRLSPRHRLYQRACERLPQRPASLWARRSLFSLGGKHILVTEVFLPGILELS